MLRKCCLSASPILETLMLLSTCQAPQPDKKEWNHDWKRRNKNQDRDHGGPGGIRTHENKS